MSLKPGPDAFWAFVFRIGLLRAPMPFWRVVIEARVDRRGGAWSRHTEFAVASVFVWARTIEEAEGLASLALEEEGLHALTADAMKCPPAARPHRTPTAVSRGPVGLIPRLRDGMTIDPPSWRDART
ncbi:MAG: hypothetical protein WDM79_08920 [Terricaulis sp.]